MDFPEAEGKKIRKNYRGIFQRQAGSWGVRIYDPNKRAQVRVGSFNTADEAAMAYDEAALKFRGHKAILNFPERATEASKPTPLSPCSIPDAQSQNHQFGLEGLQQDHQNVGNLRETVCTSQYESCSRLDVGNVEQQEDFSLNDLLTFDDLPEHGSYAPSIMLTALEKPTQGTFDDRVPLPRTEFPYGPDVLEAASWPQTKAFEDGRSAQYDETSKMMVKVFYKDGIIVKFELPFSSTKLELEEKVAVRLKLSVGSFEVRYEDEDKEWISIVCDEDLKTCMSTSRLLGNATIRMMVVCN